MRSKGSRVRLGVNIDHVATVRQARLGHLPDPVEAAILCQSAGADSIVCHLREDRRHIQDEDVRRLRRRLGIALNLEMSIAPNVVSVALSVRPLQVTLVPERRQELTTEGGLDVKHQQKALATIIKRLRARGIVVSLFVDPVMAQINACRNVGATIVELHTGAFAEAKSAAVRHRALSALKRSCAQAKKNGLAVAAGHGLDYENISDIVAIPEIEEVNIGFSIITHALEVGLEGAVRRMRSCLRRKQGQAR